MNSIDRPFWVKNSGRASSTLLQELVWSYIKTTNRSIIGIWSWSYLSDKGTLPIASNASTTSGNTLVVLHAVFFPFLRKNDVWSHPVKAWNISMDIAFWGPMFRTMMWAGISLRVLPVPNRIHISVKFVWVIKALHKTTTSVSTVWSIIRRHLSVAASATCRRSLVFASSCVPGERRLVFAAGEFSRINLPKVDMIFPLLSISSPIPVRGMQKVPSCYRRSSGMPASYPGSWCRIGRVVLFLCHASF